MKSASNHLLASAGKPLTERIQGMAAEEPEAVFAHDLADGGAHPGPETVDGAVQARRLGLAMDAGIHGGRWHNQAARGTLDRDLAECHAGAGTGGRSSTRSPTDGVRAGKPCFLPRNNLALGREYVRPMTPPKKK